MSVVLARKHANGPTDAELLARIAGGQLDALGTLFDRHAAVLHQLITRIAPRDDADDVVQETFLRIPRIAERFEVRGESARAWVLTVGHTIVRERRRAGARFLRAVARFAGTESDRTVAPRGAARTDVERCLDALSPEKRDVLVLTEVMGMSGPEAAEVLAIPVGTVWTRLHHARRELREKLGGNDG